MTLIALGCDKTTPQSFRPDEEAAQDALITALTAWKDGKPPTPIKERERTIQIVDKIWEKKAKLKGFEILSSDKTDTTTNFKVKIEVEKALAPQELIYVVVGKNPIWIFREEDYKQGGGM
jgi:hypothetical protein